MALFARNQRTGSRDDNDAARTPRAVAFVDYEHWLYSLENMYGMKPDIGHWVEDVRSRAILTELVFFADFSKMRDKSEEIKRIREYSNKIIDTCNPSVHHMKDYTDFIMLDNIYQRANDSDHIDMFIIFTGDGHFSSVVSYLRNILGKEVGIYGVARAMSQTLRNTADWAVEVPDEYQLSRPYMTVVLNELRANEDRAGGRATYERTVSQIAQREKVSEKVVDGALNMLIESRYIEVVEDRNSRRAKIKALEVDWEKAYKDGLCGKPPKKAAEPVRETAKPVAREQVKTDVPPAPKRRAQSAENKLPAKTPPAAKTAVRSAEPKNEAPKAAVRPAPPKSGAAGNDQVKRAQPGTPVATRVRVAKPGVHSVGTYRRSAD